MQYLIILLFLVGCAQEKSESLRSEYIEPVKCENSSLYPVCMYDGSLCITECGEKFHFTRCYSPVQEVDGLAHAQHVHSEGMTLDLRLCDILDGKLNPYGLFYQHPASERYRK